MSRRLKILRGAISIILLTSFVCSAGAQDKSKYFTQMHPENFTIDWVAFYNAADEGTTRVRKEFPHHLDLSFGDHAKQALDLYLPKGEVRKAPVFLFLHGGGFREGDRAHYGFVAEPFLRAGIITAVASYRLTTQGFHFPDQPDDVEAAIAWIHENVERFGGDPNNIYVGGHSAGAILSAHVGVRNDWLKARHLPAGIIRGIAPISGPYDLRVGAYEERPGEADAYVADASLRAEASPIANIQTAPPRAVIALGGVEEKYLASSREFADALRLQGTQVDFLVLKDLDHDQTALTLADFSSELCKAVLAMIRKGSK